MANLDDIEKNLELDFPNFISEYRKFLEEQSEVQIILTPDNRRKVDKTITDFIMQLSKMEAKRVRYDSITSAVIELNRNIYEKNSNQQGLDNLILYIQQDCLRNIISEFKNGFFNGKPIQDEETLQNSIIAFYKLVEHTSLANIQYRTLYADTEEKLQDYKSQLEEANKIIEENRELSANLTSVKNSTEETEKRINQMEERYTGIYTDFIAILGIFSSFVFVMFGGFSALSSILDSLSRVNISIVRTLLISSILVGFLITIVYTLILWVAKIAEKPFLDKSCSCSKRCNNIIHIMGRHRFYVILMGVSLLTAIIGFILLIFGIE